MFPTFFSMFTVLAFSFPLFLMNSPYTQHPSIFSFYRKSGAAAALMIRRRNHISSLLFAVSLTLLSTKEREIHTLESHVF
jgi:hypothetical protein